jgi:hypothetical protein
VSWPASPPASLIAGRQPAGGSNNATIRHRTGPAWCGEAGEAELKSAPQTSCNLLRELGPEVRWVHGYVTDDKINCICRAPNAEMLWEHARKGGFPADSISEVRSMMDPTTAE